jgi:hypothetical protein
MGKLQKGGLDSSDVTAITIVVIVLVVGLAIGLGVYFGVYYKKGDSSTPPPPKTPLIPWDPTNQGGSGSFCATSVYVTNTQIQNPTSSTPSLHVNYEISPRNVSGSVSGTYTDSTVSVSASSVDATIGSLTFNFSSRPNSGYHNGTVELTYTGTNGCKITQSSPVSFFV